MENVNAVCIFDTEASKKLKIRKYEVFLIQAIFDILCKGLSIMQTILGGASIQYFNHIIFRSVENCPIKFRCKALIKKQR